MCGIAGIAYVSSPPLHRVELEKELSRAEQLLAHRGPDDAGIWISDDDTVGFIHRRLAILDLSPRAHQPMRDASGNVITFNGEIYNFHELRIQFPDNEYVSESDTEVLLKGLAKTGPDFLTEIEGMFAFAFYSKKEDRLLLAVDPAGEKPIYTYWDGKIFAFASEIKALTAFTGISLIADPERLKESLIYGYVPWPRTVYRNINKIPAGHFQRVDLRRGPEEIRQYWDVPLGQVCHNWSTEQATDSLREILSQSVRRRLVSDVPVGSFLSGGVDSSAVSWEAAQLLTPARLQTFSAGFSHDAESAFYDETKYAAYVAKLIHSDHRVLQIDASTIDAAAIMRRFDEPFGDSSAIPTYLLCEKTSQHVKVVLSGDGGDELFGGYQRFGASLIAERFKTLWQMALSPVLWMDAAPRSFLGKLQRFRRAVNSPLLKRLAVWNSFFAEDDLKRFLGDSETSVFESLKYWDEKTKGISIGEKILYYNFKTYLFDDLLPKVDRMSMAHALEVRAPFLDKTLIKFAFSLPTHMKFDAFHTKRILKQAYRHDLGATITDRAKHGFAFPLPTFLGNQTSRTSTQALRKLFPQSPLSTTAISSPNRTSKDFILWTVDQCLSNGMQIQNAI